MFKKGIRISLNKYPLFLTENTFERFKILLTSKKLSRLQAFQKYVQETNLNSLTYRDLNNTVKYL